MFVPKLKLPDTKMGQDKDVLTYATVDQGKKQSIYELAHSKRIKSRRYNLFFRNLKTPHFLGGHYVSTDGDFAYVILTGDVYLLKRLAKKTEE